MLSKQRHLAAWRAEGAAIEPHLLASFEAQSPGSLGKALRQQFGKHAFTAHPRPKPAVVQLAATALANQAQYMGGALRVMIVQPLLE